MSEKANLRPNVVLDSSIEGRRRQLADDLGYLLARYWLEQDNTSPLLPLEKQETNIAAKRRGRRRMP